MLELLRSISLGTGAVLIAVTSAVVAVGLIRISNVFLKWCLAIFISTACSYVLYWSPVWLGAEPYEYAVWELAALIPWTLAGLIASAIVFNIMSRTNFHRSS